MSFLRGVLVAIVSGVGVAGFAGSVAAQPSIPATYFGSVTVNGEPAPTGAEIRALVNGNDCTQAAPGERPAIRQGEATAYVIAVVHESQRQGCATAGAIVSFTVDGVLANETAEWEPGPKQVDLTVGEGEPVPLPTATPTVPGPPPTSTSLPSEPSPLPGTPPTDDVTLPGTPQPTNDGDGGVSAAGADDEGGGSSVLPVMVAGLAVLSVAGVAGGLLWRRRSAPAEGESP